ncbi:MAG TPA: hypothetical protein EYG98_01510, partial [Sulfurovum sp.]|nr:hypothetical protein [Sulfurovum sp.]
FTGDPTPITYTVADEEGTVSEPATVTVDYPQDDPNTVHIGDYFWIDTNANNIVDAGEIPIVGAKVELLDENGEPVIDADCLNSEDIIDEYEIAGFPLDGICTSYIEITDENGNYGFDVEPGIYQVRFTLPEDMVADQFIFTDTGKEGVVVDSDILTYTVDASDGNVRLDTDAGANCGCTNISSDSMPSLSIWGTIMMIFISGFLGLVFVRREEILAH